MDLKTVEYRKLPGTLLPPPVEVHQRPNTSANITDTVWHRRSALTDRANQQFAKQLEKHQRRGASLIVLGIPSVLTSLMAASKLGEVCFLGEAIVFVEEISVVGVAIPSIAYIAIIVALLVVGILWIKYGTTCCMDYALTICYVWDAEAQTGRYRPGDHLSAAMLARAKIFVDMGGCIAYKPMSLPNGETVQSLLGKGFEIEWVKHKGTAKQYARLATNTRVSYEVQDDRVPVLINRPLIDFLKGYCVVIGSSGWWEPESVKAMLSRLGLSCADAYDGNRTKESLPWFSVWRWIAWLGGPFMKAYAYNTHTGNRKHIIIDDSLYQLQAFPASQGIHPSQFGMLPKDKKPITDQKCIRDMHDLWTLALRQAHNTVTPPQSSP